MHGLISDYTGWQVEASKSSVGTCIYIIIQVHAYFTGKIPGGGGGGLLG